MTKLRFDPPKSVGRYALFVDHGEGNNSFFKVYNDLGHAKNGARARTRYGGDRTAKILEMVDGEWYVLFDIPKGADEFPWVKEFTPRWSSRARKRSRPMTRDEYAEFRMAVLKEQIREKNGLLSTVSL